uniref:UBC core domain-containing protein n=1 Tax=Paramoeba aestuarina TaxID=180227 RepID=A0A7S4P9W7_9EUKA|mmetsp:Transcript_38397/g.60834  ORF Transcript_38397/g.60834 Transcript_38397/m.60834 type:complete len:346 (+) Transcript_38397:216-1253(+)
MGNGKSKGSSSKSNGLQHLAHLEGKNYQDMKNMNLDDLKTPISTDYAKHFVSRGLLFDEYDIFKNCKQFTYGGRGENCGISKVGIKRLIKEQAAFPALLPLHPDSSVFVRVDENTPTAMQALVVGPAGTPYAQGCFLFDILCEDYPNRPPQVTLSTTGHGAVRFNPNLYDSGYVCLSLLGTWPGQGKSENWDKDVSSLLQLFVSIQGLIMVDEPYYNEPGYEGSSCPEQSESYNKNIRYQTTKWAIVDQLNNPPKGFEEVIKLHFQLQKDSILEQTKKWMEEHGESGKKLLKEVEKVLEKNGEPPKLKNEKKEKKETKEKGKEKEKEEKKEESKESKRKMKITLW